LLDTSVLDVLSERARRPLHPYRVRR
jgi:hypothetical protein